MGVISRIRSAIKRWRSAITGRFVSSRFAKDNPSTTIGERIAKADKEA